MVSESPHSSFTWSVRNQQFTPFRYLVTLDLMCSFSFQQMMSEIMDGVLILDRKAAVRPVTNTSMSMHPVVGSVADCWVAILIKAMASLTSDSSTNLDSLILAMDSEILIRDSSCLGVAEITFLLIPTDLIFTYAWESLSDAASVSLGLMYNLAKVIQLVRNSLVKYPW